MVLSLNTYLIVTWRTDSNRMVSRFGVLWERGRKGMGKGVYSRDGDGG